MKRVLTQAVSVLLAVITLFSCGKSVQARWQEQLDLGMKYLEELDYEQAILAFTKAIEIDPKQAAAYIGRAQAYVQRGNEEDLLRARDDYEKAIELGEDTVDVFLELAAVYEDLGDFEKALEIIRKGYDLTGAPELEKRLEELESDPEPETEPETPERESLEGYPKTERYDQEDGSYLVREYNAFGNLIRECYCSPEGEIWNERIWSEDNPDRTLYNKTTTFFNGDEGTGVAGFDIITYQYQGAEVLIEEAYTIFTDGMGTAEYSITYQMADESNSVWVQFWDWGGDVVHLLEHSGDGISARYVDVGVDGAVISAEEFVAR